MANIRVAAVILSFTIFILAILVAGNYILHDLDSKKMVVVTYAINGGRTLTDGWNGTVVLGSSDRVNETDGGVMVCRVSAGMPCYLIPGKKLKTIGGLGGNA